MGRSARGWSGQGARGAVAIVAVLFSCLPYSWIRLPDVRVLAERNPASTAFMQRRADEAVAAGRPVHRVHHWIDYDRIAPTLIRAVVVSEDAAFWSHDGIDLAEIRASMAVNLREGRLTRGGSTITQQLAKNLYLSPSRNPYRKLEELLIARRLEAELSKTRILELYLNLVEWGDGVWGAEAAARTYFRTSAASLTREQAALLAGALINPLVYSPARPNARLRSRRQIILRRMGDAGPVLPSRPPTLEAPVTTDVPPAAFGPPASISPR